MEKFFQIKEDCKLYQDYFAFIEMKAKMNNLFDTFTKTHQLSGQKFILNPNRLIIELNEQEQQTYANDLITNQNYKIHNIYTFKKNAKLCKEWVKRCKDLAIQEQTKPMIGFYFNANLYSFRQRLFHIGTNLYGSLDNKKDSDFALDDFAIELKASEFYKIIEDFEEKQETK